jgi:hypothetical protein
MSTRPSFFARLHPRRLISGPPPPPPPAPLPPGGGQAVAPTELAERRDLLARELAELQWDLGGLAYEMAIRDHFRLDVLMRQAARLQEVDARLGEVEHLLRLETTGAAGACPRCGTLYARGALFCSNCAFQLVETGAAMGTLASNGLAGGGAPSAPAPAGSVPPAGGTAPTTELPALAGTHGGDVPTTELPRSEPPPAGAPSVAGLPGADPANGVAGLPAADEQSSPLEPR